LSGVDLSVLVAYLAAMVGIGVWASHGHHSSDDFMAGGRNLPGWAVGLSIFGTYVSSISFLALPGKAYAENWNAFVFSLTIPLAAWIAVRWFVPFYRAAGQISSYEHLEQRFGPWARTYAVACYLLTQIARGGTIMYLLALALAPLTGWSLPALILATGGVVIVYALYGGMVAVIWTDVVQSVIFIIGALACVVVLLAGMPAGPSQLTEIAAASDKFSLGSFGPALNTTTFWVVLFYGMFINLQNFGIDQTYVQRYQTARSDGAARRSVWIGALLYVPISAAFFFIGTGLFAYYTARPDLLPAGAAVKPDTVFPHFIATALPPGMGGLVIAAIFAAAQSTISSSINSSATLILCDIYQRWMQPAATELQRLRVLRGATLLMGLLGTGMALAMMRIKSALDAWWQLAGLFGGAMLGLFLLGFLSRRATSRSAARGVAAGVLVILWITFSPAYVHNYLAIVVGTLVVLAVGRLAPAQEGERVRG
jgi:SSS family solute:Na+ symporter